MQKNSRVLGAAIASLAIAVLVVGFVIVRPVLAQEESTSSDQIVATTPLVDVVSSATSSDISAPAVSASATPTVECASTETTDTSAAGAPPPPPPPPPAQTSAPTDGQVEVQLQC